MMENSEKLWNSIKDIYSSILKHPFILELVEGTLSRNKFEYYIIQDYLYLREFSKALALLSAKAEDEENALLFAIHIQDAIKVEKALHKFYISEFNLDVEDYEMSPTNLAYTSYLLAVAYSRPFHEVISAVLPCYWIYMEVGKELLKKGSRDKYYQKWIETYGGEDYERGVRAVLGIVNGLKVSEEEFNKMKIHFRTASIYEYMFWDSAYRLERFPFLQKKIKECN
ncbi:transcriptional activator, TenA family [Sulfolobus islandicus Y.N.15.51]|jgi:thiaminase/4-amino-5-aminomethyl-2-methylpyrimidine deaminase|uniref:Transcriptional activator, TenA family n=1 Tax=Saccharolobus islandicus (strain Y.N.15.51 / Yellowstone \|nr:thiaminase II [Sulfolobus islandicus]ACP49965.1 transcriptional activator, TenA family [Sulfolobus islandicus Y.N.15.51]